MSGNRISRTKIVDGVVTPAFIHNSAHYFINLQVYADGLVNCWELLDLALFAKKLESGWVRTSVPDGKSISVHGLGSWTVAGGRWQVTAAGMRARVRKLVKQLNPRLENLHDCGGRTTIDGPGKMRTSILGSPRERPVREVLDGHRTRRHDGDHLSIFVRQNTVTYLADLRAFADGTIELGRLPDPEVLDLAGLRAAIDEGRVLSEPAVGSRVTIHELGDLALGDDLSTTNIEQLFRQVPDLIDTANGRPDSVGRCHTAHTLFQADPSDAHREALRVAYEAIPEHNRMYVGDMDTRDGAVRFALYGEGFEDDA